MIICIKLFNTCNDICWVNKRDERASATQHISVSLSLSLTRVNIYVWSMI